MVSGGRLRQSRRVSGAAPIICLVDDDPSVLKSLGRLLAAEGYALLSFSDPAEFIKHAASHPVPLVVLDYQMPGLTGLHVQNCLHSLSPESRVIVISASEDDHIRAAALAGGARGFFHKPFDQDALLAAVREALTSAENSRP